MCKQLLLLSTHGTGLSCHHFQVVPYSCSECLSCSTLWAPWASCSIFQQWMFKLFHTLAPLGKLLVILTNIFRLFYILICLYKLFLPVVGLPLIFGLILCRYPKPSVTATHTVFLPHIQKCKKMRYVYTPWMEIKLQVSVNIYYVYTCVILYGIYYRKKNIFAANDSYVLFSSFC